MRKSLGKADKNFQNSFSGFTKKSVKDPEKFVILPETKVKSEAINSTIQKIYER